MNLRQAAQQALEAKQVPLIELLESVPADARMVYEHGKFHSQNIPVGRLCHEAVAALRDALAEPEQEPVAWQWLDTANYRKRLPANAIPEHWRPLYTAPTPRKPLTVFEIDAIAEHLDKTTIGWATHEFAAAIEKAHGIGEQHE